MQVATLFRETAKVLGASMDSIQCCMKSESQADDGYETCIDTVCGNHVERMLGGGGGPTNSLEQNLRHVGIEDNFGHHHQRSSLTGGMKMEQYGDPYSFVDESNNLCLPNNNFTNSSHLPPQTKKRGRRKKPDLNVKMDDYGIIVSRNNNSGRDNNDAIMDKERKRHDRFNGLSEEEVSQRILPDHLAPNLDIVIIGINPGLFAAYKGHHYAGPGNHFWKCLYLSGLVPEPLTAEDDCRLLRHGIGFTNMVARPTKGSADLTRREIKQGSQILQEKLQKYRPKVAVFNGKLIYEVFSGKKDFPFGRQPEFVEGTNTYIWVMPSSSARCAQLPRAADKVPFYTALKRFRDYLNGLISELDESEIVFNSDSKPMSGSKNGDLKNSMEPNSCSPLDETDLGSFIPDVIVTNKKKRGRPRKGTNPPTSNNVSNNKREKLMKKEMLPELNGKKMDVDKNKSNCFDGLSVMDNLKRSVGGGSGNSNNNNGTRPVVEIQRKRRGRPKKLKPEDSPPSFSTIGNLGNSTTPDSVLLLETSSGGATNNSNSVTCQPPTASSVSSGYSTATSTGGEERIRNRDENGSGGPSPSQCYTQSDLSSEISAAISCGSAPPSPLINGHTTDSVFDGLSSVLNQSSREDSQNKSIMNNNASQQQQSLSSSKLSMSSVQGNQRLLSPNSHCGPSSSASMYMNPPHDPSSYMPYHHQSFDNRLHSLTNRSQLYQPSNVRDGTTESSMQSSSNSSFHGQPSTYETTKTFDVASKSLSGLESLVDQIPSIADSDVGTVASVAGSCLPPGLLPDSISHHHSQSLSNVTSTGALSHSGHYVSNEPGGFLPYGQPNSSSYGNSSHHYTPTYYTSELSSAGFPVNSLSPAAAAYCSPSPLFGFSSYGQYPSTHGPSGYPHSSAAAAAALHLQSAYGPPPGYPPSAYSTVQPNPYQHGNSSAGSSGQRFPQRLHGGIDLGHMGFSGGF